MTTNTVIAGTGLKAQLSEIVNQCPEPEDASVPNHLRRKLYAQIELLRREIEEAEEEEGNTPMGSSSTSSQRQERQEVLGDLKAYSARLGLRVQEATRSLGAQLDAAARNVGVWLCLMTFATTLALPCILLRPLDGLLIVYVSGIELEVTGDLRCFESSSTLACYSHTSTMDAFILSYVVPVRQLAIAKVELFLIPFFSWLLVAFGGVPVERGSRDKSVRVLRGVVRNIGLSGRNNPACDCVVIAPEGTRSTTGQLLDFKKGPFYIWEALGVDVVPIVVFGAYELFPRGQAMNAVGRVVVRVLPAIARGEARSRADMTRLLRRRMLEALALEPDHVAAYSRTAGNTARSYALLAGVAVLDYWLVRLLRDVLVVRCGLSLLASVLSCVGGSVAITLLIYIYAVKIIPWLSPPAPAASEAVAKKTK